MREPKYRCHATQVLEKVCCMSSGLVYSSLQCVAVCFAVATMRRLKKRLLSYRVHVRESSHSCHPMYTKRFFSYRVSTMGRPPSHARGPF